uniref:Uncharacterized protein n=1 Tax=Timema tahoe TaxID=61484 RepID=A0A7R9P0Z0_9NEOP|nr:unnamed protein product [Timema tahoe]
MLDTEEDIKGKLSMCRPWLITDMLDTEEDIKGELSMCRPWLITDMLDTEEDIKGKLSMLYLLTLLYSPCPGLYLLTLFYSPCPGLYLLTLFYSPCPDLYLLTLLYSPCPDLYLLTLLYSPCPDMYLLTLFYSPCPGLYLYMLVVETFSGENIKLRVYVVIGWAVTGPALPQRSASFSLLSMASYIRSLDTPKPSTSIPTSSSHRAREQPINLAVVSIPLKEFLGILFSAMRLTVAKFPHSQLCMKVVCWGAPAVFIVIWAIVKSVVPAIATSETQVTFLLRLLQYPCGFVRLPSCYVYSNIHAVLSGYLLATSTPISTRFCQVTFLLRLLQYPRGFVRLPSCYVYSNIRAKLLWVIRKDCRDWKTLKLML